MPPATSASTTAAPPTSRPVRRPLPPPAGVGSVPGCSRGAAAAASHRAGVRPAAGRRRWSGGRAGWWASAPSASWNRRVATGARSRHPVAVVEACCRPEAEAGREETSCRTWDHPGARGRRDRRTSCRPGHVFTPGDRAPSGERQAARRNAVGGRWRGRHRGHRHAGGARRLECCGRGPQRRRGGDDVVDDEHPGRGHRRDGPRNRRTGQPAGRGRARSAGRRPSSRSSSRRHGSPSWRATWRATSSAWSNPRWCRRRALVGAHVTTSTAVDPAATRRLTSRPARWAATGRRLRYLKPRSTSRTRPVNGAATTTPGGPSERRGRRGRSGRCGRARRRGGRSRRTGWGRR